LQRLVRLSYSLRVAARSVLMPAPSQTAYKTFTQLILEHRALLLEYAQPLLSLQVEHEAALRHLLASVLVECVTKAGELMPVALATATTLTRVTTCPLPLATPPPADAHISLRAPTRTPRRQWPSAPWWPA
jgi:hypothetical protein